MFRFSRYLTNIADNFGSRLMACIITFFSTCRRVQSVSALADDMRTSWPASPPSPKKSPSAKMASVASFPASDTTLSCTFPVCTKNRPSVESPCAKMVCFLRKDAMSLPFPIVERKAWGLNAVVFVVLAVCFNKDRPDGDATGFNYGGRPESWLVTCAHNQECEFGGSRSETSRAPRGEPSPCVPLGGQARKRPNPKVRPEVGLAYGKVK